MLREKIVTIVIGLVVGALLAGLFFFGPRLVSKDQDTKSPVSLTPVPTKLGSLSPEPSLQASLKIDSPEDNSSTTDSQIKISGTTSPNGKIIIFSNTDEKMATAGAEGKFESTVKLEEGENELIIVNPANPSAKIVRNITLEISQ